MGPAALPDSRFVNPLWLIPGGVALLGGAAVVALLRNAAEEAKLLLDAVARQRDVGRSARRLATELAEVRRRPRSTHR